MKIHPLLRTLPLLLFLAGSSSAWGQGGSADAGNAAYRIDGREIRLVDGRAETHVTPGAAATMRTALYGEPVWGDLNGDGQDDAAVLLVQEAGGSGHFYFGRATFGDDGRVEWTGPFGATRMSGPEPLANQEQAFLGALGRAGRALLRDGRLLLESEDAKTALEFQR